MLYRNNLKNRFLAASAFPQNSRLRSRLAYRQWSLVPGENFEGPPCQIPDSLGCFDIEERCARISGVVQGVGFRARAQRIASQLGIVGHVKNLPDGSVEIRAQGESAALDLLFSQLKARFSCQVELFSPPETGSYTGFEIR